MGFVYGLVSESFHCKSKLSDRESVRVGGRSSQVRIYNTCVFTFVPGCWKSLNSWTFIPTSNPEAQSAHTNTRHLPTPPKGPLQVLANVYARLNSLTFALIIPTWLTGYLLSHLHRAGFGTSPRFERCFFSPMLLPVFSILSPQSLLFLFSAWLQTHPPIAGICWHTNTIFRKQNNPGNNAGIWKCVISLDGWVSNPRASKQGRERDCRGTLFILPRPDGEGSFGCCTPPLPVRPWHAHNTQTQLHQLVCTAVVKASYVSYSLIWLFFFFFACFSIDCWDWEFARRSNQISCCL